MLSKAYDLIRLMRSAFLMSLLVMFGEGCDCSAGKRCRLRSSEEYCSYKDVAELSHGSDRRLVEFIPPRARDIWVAHDADFGSEGWQCACVVSEMDFRDFVQMGCSNEIEVVDVLDVNEQSYPMCYKFYRERLDLLDSPRPPVRDGCLEVYVYEKNSHWHRSYWYDRKAGILLCDVGR